MTNLNIKINTDNAAFSDSNLGSEIARILKSYANAIETVVDPDTSWKLETKLRDINGNTVGQVKLQMEDFFLMDRDMKKILEVLSEQQKTLSKLETSMKMLSEASLSFATNQQTVNKSMKEGMVALKDGIKDLFFSIQQITSFITRGKN